LKEQPKRERRKKQHTTRERGKRRAATHQKPQKEKTERRGRGKWVEGEVMVGKT